jgi:hypothetical protein
MIRMFLTGCVLYVCLYWTYERDQDGTVPSLGLIDGDINLLRGLDCVILI